VQDQELYAEVDAFDRLIVFSKIDSNTVRARIHRERPTPLEEDAAAEVIRKRLAEWGVSFAGASTGHSSRYGVLRYSVTRGKETIAEASFGLFTGEMLSFERPLAAAYRARPRRPVEKLRLRSGGKVTTKDGIVIRWERRSHKHKVGGGAVGIWSFRVSKDGKSRSIGVTSESLYAELLAFERVFTLSSIDYDTVEVGVHTKRRRMSDHRALRKAQDLGKRIGMDSDGSVLSEEAGAHEFILRKGQRDLVWGKIGAYTHAIVAYILRDRPADAAERPPL
jgi:hypothetical protein